MVMRGSRNQIPQLVAQVEALTAELETLRQEVDTVKAERGMPAGGGRGIVNVADAGGGGGARGGAGGVPNGGRKDP